MEDLQSTSLQGQNFSEVGTIHATEDYPTEPKRRKLGNDLDSNCSSRTCSPVSVESFFDESCSTPSDSPFRYSQDLRRHYRKDELWAAIESNYEYLMDKEIIETCRSTESDLSLEDEDPSAIPNVSFNEFMQQYKELTDWMNQIQLFTRRKVMMSRSEKYLNQTYYEELLQRSPRRKLLNEYAREVLRRYPHVKGQVAVCLQGLNSQWQLIEQAISPGKSFQDRQTMLRDLEDDLNHLSKWLHEVESCLLPMCVRASWGMSELEEKLKEHQVLQKDIESHSRIVSAVLKLSERLQNAPPDRDDPRESLQLASHNLEKRWHAIWLQSLEWQCRLEQTISSKKELTVVNDIPGFSPDNFWNGSQRDGSSDEHVHDVGGSSLSDQGEEADCHNLPNQNTMPGKQTFYDDDFVSKHVSDLSDFQYVLSLNRENELQKPALWPNSADICKRLNDDLHSDVSIVSNIGICSYGSKHNYSPGGRRHIGSSSQKFYTMVALDTDCSTDSHDDHSGRINNEGSMHSSSSSGIVTDINSSNSNKGNAADSTTTDRAKNISGENFTNEGTAKLSENSFSGDLQKYVVQEQICVSSSECGRSELSSSDVNDNDHKKIGLVKGKKSYVSSSLSWSAEGVVESSCDASGEESGDSDSSEDFSTATDDTHENIFSSSAHLDEGASALLVHRRDSCCEVFKASVLHERWSKERPWSVMELYEQSNDLDLKPFFISESALDQISNRPMAATTTPTRNSCPPNFSSATFPRQKQKDRFNRRFHLMADDGPVHVGVKRKLQSASNERKVEGGFTAAAQTRSWSSESELSLSSELAQQLQKTFVHSSLSDTESDSGGAYGTAIEDVSDNEDLLVSTASFSEADWDNYQVPLYPTVSDDAVEEPLHWSHEMEFDELATSTGNSSIIKQIIAKQNEEDSGMASSRSLQCDDSDSDLEDFYHVLDESANQLKVTDHALQKKKKDTGLHLNSGRYSELLATCQTNIKCLELIKQHLDDSTPVGGDDLHRMQVLMYQWEKLQALAVERQTQSRELAIINDGLKHTESWLQEFTTLVEKQQFSGLEDILVVLKNIQKKQMALTEKQCKLNDLRKVLTCFHENNPTINVDGYLTEIDTASNSVLHLEDCCSTKLLELNSQLLSWYDYMETKKELEYMLTQQRSQLDTLLFRQQVNFQGERMNVFHDLKVTQKNLALCEEKFEQLHNNRRQLTTIMDEQSTAQLSAEFSEVRNLLYMLTEQCHSAEEVAHQHIATHIDNVEEEEETENSSIVSLNEERPVERPRRYCHWQRVVLVCLTGLMYLADPDMLQKITDFSINISPELRHVNGPPPT